MTTPVPVLLDLREYTEVPPTPEGYQALWNRLEPTLVTQNPKETRTLRFGHGPRGVIGIRFLDPDANPAVLDRRTVFAIRGVLEPPTVRYGCAVGHPAERPAYGPFRCARCQAQNRDRWLCDEHATMLDGAFRAVCPEHIPRCSGGGSCGPATFWCAGPRCARKKAWCENHRRRHPGDRRIAYCPDCYAIRFPPCVVDGCALTGYVRCEYTSNRQGDACGGRACARHASRWQVFGPHKRGLGLCPEHKAKLSGVSREGLIYQLTAGTIRRHEARRRPGAPQLPRLTLVRHILLHVRDEALDMGTINGCFDRVRQSLGTGRHDLAMARLLDADAPARERAVIEDKRLQEIGRRHFEELRALLVSDGKRELAARISYSDFRSEILRVRVPADLMGRFYGRQHATVNGLSKRLGITVKVEQR